jgi:hypothetical protein
MAHFVRVAFAGPHGAFLSINEARIIARYLPVIGAESVLIEKPSCYKQPVTGAGRDTSGKIFCSDQREPL